MEKTIRQIAREKAVIAVYQWLTVDASKEELKEYVHADEALLEGRSAEQFCYWLIDTVMENKRIVLLIYLQAKIGRAHV